MKDVVARLDVDITSPYVRVDGETILITPPPADDGEWVRDDNWVDLGFITEA